ncbi:glucosamine-6-phosphate deaminase [Chitinophaga polysaccharea]|uniref:glucosamine-6-phosphate deaminase n=1 Tax=Chitinophaga polysaccharea TaxID=1293035 RepID=UPI001158C60A|nr:glucosamine-6-phosphate deaminase [Chitinophaga polysaccharea]
MIKEFKAGQLTVKIYPERRAMGNAAAAMISATLRRLLEQKEAVSIIFAAAPSQDEMLEALVKETGIEWSRVHAFHMDEYIGLPADAPQGFGNFLKQRIFDLLPFRTVNYIDGSGTEAACVKYGCLLQAHPADIVCMGIGENGHLAFNDPPVADFNDPLPVKIVELDEVCRQQQVNDGCFATLAAVPTHAVTLTIPSLLQAPHIFCVVPGVRKAMAVYDTIHQNIQPQHPSTILRNHSGATLFLDAQSSDQLSIQKKG